MKRVLYAATICLTAAFAAFGGGGRVQAQGGGTGTIEGHVRLTGQAPKSRRGPRPRTVC